MAATMRVEIVSAEQEVYTGVVEELYAPAISGGVGILPRHVQFITQLKPGEVKVRPEGSTEFESFYINGGIFEVQPTIVTILSDTGMRADDLDEAKALEAKKKAEELLKDRGGEVDMAEVQAQLVEASAQLQLIQQLRKRR